LEEEANFPERGGTTSEGGPGQEGTGAGGGGPGFKKKTDQTTDLKKNWEKGEGLGRTCLQDRNLNWGGEPGFWRKGDSSDGTDKKKKGSPTSKKGKTSSGTDSEPWEQRSGRV